MKASVCFIAFLCACVSADRAAAPSPDPQTFFQTFGAQERVINLALASGVNTARLHVTAQFADGTAVPTTILYSAGDSTITVDSTGLVRAQFVTTNEAVVRISTTYAGLTRRDSVRVQVREVPPTPSVERVAIAPPSGAVPSVAIRDTTFAPGTQQLQIVALDANATPVSDVLLDVHSLDTTIVTVDPSGIVTAKRPGITKIVAGATVYGVPVADTLPFSVSLSQYGFFNILSPTLRNNAEPTWTFGGPGANTVHLAVAGSGAIVYWQNEGTTLVAVKFDKPELVAGASNGWSSEVTSGDIAPFGAGTLSPAEDGLAYYDAVSRARRFPVPGTYHFQVIPSDPSAPRLDGTVVVCATTATTCGD